MGHYSTLQLKNEIIGIEMITTLNALDRNLIFFHSQLTNYFVLLFLPLSCLERLAHVLGQNFILSGFVQSAILQNLCFEQVLGHNSSARLFVQSTILQYLDSSSEKKIYKTLMPRNV